MIRLISAAVAFALMASPVLAASKQNRSNAGKAQASDISSNAKPMYPPYYASAVPPQGPANGTDGIAVFKDGFYVGQDPDAGVRLNLLRDAGQ
jgi:hypothetical protein